MNIDEMDTEIAVIVRQQASLRQKQLDNQRERWQIFGSVELSTSNAQWEALSQMSVDLAAHKKQIMAAREGQASRQDSLLRSA